MLRLSVLDILWPGNLPRLVQRLDELGYHRFWATEHHSEIQSASPTLVAALAAAMTGQLRVGTAGVLLNYACPAKVAEDFRLLELYFPGRVDLGVAGAPASQHEADYLDGRPPPTRESYAARVRALVEIMRGEHRIKPGPRGATAPPLWLCGSSRGSAELAASLGMNFAFHRYIAGSTPAAREAIDAYRERFRGPAGATPYAAVALYGACAETAAGARDLWTRSDAGAACFAGAPGECAEQLHALRAATGADELIVNLFVRDPDAQLAGYGLLAEAVGLAAAVATDPPAG